MTSHLDPYTFILVDRKPVQHANDEEWWRWYLNEENRRVAKTQFESGLITVSTVFTSLDLLPERGKLFETKVFGGKLDQEEWRCATWEEAEAQHAKAVALVRETLPHE